MVGLWIMDVVTIIIWPTACQLLDWCCMCRFSRKLGALAQPDGEVLLFSGENGPVSFFEKDMIV